MTGAAMTKVNLPDGKYDGVWGGWQVCIDYTSICFETSIGVRGFNIPVEITIVNGYATFTD